MHRPFLLLAALVIANPGAASAGPQPSGTIACDVAGNPITGLRVSPPISALPSPIRPILKDTIYGHCDDAGVVGAKGIIGEVRGKLLARLATGSTCLDLVTAPEFTFAKLKLTWRGPNAVGRMRTVATSTTHLVSGSWDSGTGSLTFTGEIFKGAFVGSTFTLRLTLDTPELLDAACAPTDAIFYGKDDASVLTVP